MFLYRGVASSSLQLAHGPERSSILPSDQNQSANIPGPWKMDPIAVTDVDCMCIQITSSVRTVGLCNVSIVAQVMS